MACWEIPLFANIMRTEVWLKQNVNCRTCNKCMLPWEHFITFTVSLMRKTQHTSLMHQNERQTRSPPLPPNSRCTLHTQCDRRVHRKHPNKVLLVLRRTPTPAYTYWKPIPLVTQLEPWLLFFSGIDSQMWYQMPRRKDVCYPYFAAVFLESRGKTKIMELHCNFRDFFYWPLSLRYDQWLTPSYCRWVGVALTECRKLVVLTKLA